MSRRDGNININELIDTYKLAKDAEDIYKKKSKELNDKIKKYFNDNDIDTASSDKWVAKITITQKESLDDDKAIEILKKELSDDLLAKVVKAKEYIDDDALEKLVYNGEFDIEKLASCKVVGNPITTLRISEKK